MTKIVQLISKKPTEIFMLMYYVIICINKFVIYVRLFILNLIHLIKLDENYRYLEMLRNRIIIAVRVIFTAKFNKLFVLFTPVKWPAKFPDLTPFDFYLWTT